MMNDELPQPDHWKQVIDPPDVGFQLPYWICRYCEAKVVNEYGSWYRKDFHDGLGEVGPFRDKTRRIDWRANHQPWCIVPRYLDEIGMGPRNA